MGRCCLAGLVAACFLMACGDEATTSGDVPATEGVTDVAQVDTTGDVTGETSSCQLAQSLEGNHYRILHLYIEQPGGPDGALANTLTNIWEPQLKDALLVIMFHVTKHDVATGLMEVEAGTGFQMTEGPNKGKFEFVDKPKPGVLKMKVDGCKGASTEVGFMSIYPQYCTSDIPIKSLFVHMNFSPDGTKILDDSRLDGGLCTDSTQSLNTKFLPTSTGCINMYQFLADLGVSPNIGIDPAKSDSLPCESADKSGFVFAGRFYAEKLDNFVDGVYATSLPFSCE